MVVRLMGYPIIRAVRDVDHGRHDDGIRRRATDATDPEFGRPCAMAYKAVALVAALGIEAVDPKECTVAL